MYKKNELKLPGIALAIGSLVSGCALIDPNHPEQLATVGRYVDWKNQYNGPAIGRPAECPALLTAAKGTINSDIATLQLYVSGLIPDRFTYVDLSISQLPKSSSDAIARLAPCDPGKMAVAPVITGVAAELGQKAIDELVKINDTERKAQAEEINKRLDSAKW